MPWGDRDGDVPVLRYKVNGKAHGAPELARLLPCAAADPDVSVQLEDGIRGDRPPEPERGALTFFFTCEDVAIHCTTE